jgi:hypothetical protein
VISSCAKVWAPLSSAIQTNGFPGRYLLENRYLSSVRASARTS